MVASDGSSIGRVVWHMTHSTEWSGPYFRPHFRTEPVLGTLPGTTVCEAHNIYVVAPLFAFELNW